MAGQFSKRNVSFLASLMPLVPWGAVALAALLGVGLTYRWCRAHPTTIEIVREVPGPSYGPVPVPDCRDEVEAARRDERAKAATDKGAAVAAAREEQRRADEAGREVTVAADGGGDYPTIGAAIAAGPAVIRVRPGTYKEGLVLGRPVEVVGDGDPGSVVVESRDETCVRMATDRATIRNLTLRCLAQTKAVAAVDVPRGRLLVEDCEIKVSVSAGLDLHCAVSVSGESADPQFRNCRITTGEAWMGVLVENKAKGTFDFCTITETNSGVQIHGPGTHATFRGCKINHGRGAGVLVASGGQGTFDYCRITQMGHPKGYAGVEVRQDGIAVQSFIHLRECRITENGGSGLVVRSGSRATVERCDLTGNTGHDSVEEKGGVIEKK